MKKNVILVILVVILGILILNQIILSRKNLKLEFMNKEYSRMILIQGDSSKLLVKITNYHLKVKEMERLIEVKDSILKACQDESEKHPPIVTSEK
jgi:hypothetical protein